MAKLGLLVVLTEPPPEREAEFNAWYDTEHIPERLALPGFLSARRWVADAPPGSGKYLATYELLSRDVLSSPEYLDRYANPTPWTRRCLGSARVFRRWACEQTTPGDALPHGMGHALYFDAMDVAPADEARLHALWDDALLPRLACVPGVLRVRRYTDPEAHPRFLVLCELADASVCAHPDWRQALGSPAARQLGALGRDFERIERLFHAYQPEARA